MFWVLEVSLYLLFCSGDLFGLPWTSYGNEIKYGALLLCLVYIVSVWWKSRRQRHRTFLEEGCLVGIVGFSVLADYFLLFTDRFVCGIVLFVLVQGWYRIALCRDPIWQANGSIRRNENYIIKTLGIMYGISLGMAVMTGWIGGVVCNMQWDETLGLVVVAVFYGTCLIQNTGLGLWLGLGRKWMPHDKEETVWLCPAIVLLFLCDIHVGLYNLKKLHLLTADSGILTAWCGAAGTLMWVFYLPSQWCVLGQLLQNRKK